MTVYSHTALGKCVFTKFHFKPFSPRLSLKINRNIPLHLRIGENEETGSGGVLFILDLYLHLHPWQMLSYLNKYGFI